MYSKRPENRVKVSLKKNESNEQKALEDKFISNEPNINDNNNGKNSRNYNLHLNKGNKNEAKEEEDDYNYSVYNLSIAKDKNFLNNIISLNEMSKSLGFNEKLFFSERKNFASNSVKFNENIFSSLDLEDQKANEDINNLLTNMQLFIRMNKKRKNNYIIDVPYNNYFFNSIDNGSTNITHRIVSRFSTEFKKKQRLNESSTIPVTHTRVSSQPFNEAYQPKKKVIKNLNYTINLNEDNIENKKINGKNSFLLYYTNEDNKAKKMNRVLNNSNILYEENKMNGNSLVNLNFLSTEKKIYSNTNVDTIKKKDARLEEEYAFDSSGNQKFLCVKRYGEENKRINDNINIDNLMLANKTKPLNKKNMKINNNLKEIVIKNINMNYPSKIFKKIRNRKSNNSNIIERFVFYSPQISYKNIFSPNSKNCLGKLYKKVSGEINGNQHYTSLIKEKGNNKNGIKININNNLKNSKSCIFKYWQDKMNNKNIKNNFNNSNSYNIKFMNSFNKVINSENGINKNNISSIKSEIDLTGNNHTLNNNSRNYSNINNNLENSHRNLYSFNSMQKNINYNKENSNNLYNSVRNNKELLYLSNNENNKINKIYFPFSNLENVKVDYSNKNNYKYIEIKLSKEISNQKMIGNNKNISKSMINKNKIINLTSMDNSKILKKYNHLFQLKKDATTKDKKEKNKYK